MQNRVCTVLLDNWIIDIVRDNYDVSFMRELVSDPA
jgi:hypothetical protein